MNETEFAYRIRQALNEGADSISYKASMRLERARQLAVSHARGAVARPDTVRLPALQLATASGAPIDAPGGAGLWSWLRGAGLLTPLIALVVGFVAIHHWHNQRFISELADVDFAVLLDEAPISAYADQGFGAMLSRPELIVSPEEIVPGGNDVDSSEDPPAADPAEGPAGESSSAPTARI